jgi:hypothetical protein
MGQFFAYENANPKTRSHWCTAWNETMVNTYLGRDFRIAQVDK